ncbi:MAG: SMP-30/gluconolactonase/LRE family protein [Planctomycetota bacterium]
MPGAAQQLRDEGSGVCRTWNRAGCHRHRYAGSPQRGSGLLRKRGWLCLSPANRAGGGPDGIIIDEEDNLWLACNQSNEVLVLEPRQGKVIAKLGDFGGIDKDGAPIGFLWSNSLVFHGDDVLVTNLSLNIGAFTSQELRTVDGQWADQVKLHTVSKIKKRIPALPK